MRPVLAMSVGCPAGIGPEVSVRAAAALSRARGIPLLVGDARVIERARAIIAPETRIILVKDACELRDLAESATGGGSTVGMLRGSDEIAVYSPSERLSAPPPFGEPDAESGRAQLAWVNQALDLVRYGQADALVTGPVSKHAIAVSGAPGSTAFRGHTEHLAERLGAGEPTMAFVSERLATALVTTHLALSKVPSAITAEGVARATVALATMLRRLRKPRARIVVAALNPHAGEGGLLGREEVERIAPGIELARERIGEAAAISGPIGAESAFRLAHDGAYDGVIAMYHDQATIACKLTGFGESVNVTLGLPIVRTSVDHGTAYDLAGTGRASARGMLEALELAARLAQER